MMLPWKRRKFEVVSPEEETTEASAPGASSSSSPAPPRPWSLGRRVGRLLGWRGRRRGSFSVSREAPSFRVLYLGHAGTARAKGEGCAEAALGRIWARSQAGRVGAAMRLSLGPQGLLLAPEGERGGQGGQGQGGQHLYLLGRVTHCAADARLPRLLAWVYRHEGRHKAEVLRCHAALAAKARQARLAATVLAQLSRDALRDHLRRAGKTRTRSTAAAARPGGQGRRLRTIAEDPLGEEEEEEEEGRLARGLRGMALHNSHDEEGGGGDPEGHPAQPHSPAMQELPLEASLGEGGGGRRDLVRNHTKHTPRTRNDLPTETLRR